MKPGDTDDNTSEMGSEEQKIHVLQQQLREALGNRDIAVGDNEVIVIREVPTPMGINSEKHRYPSADLAVVEPSGRNLAIRLEDGTMVIMPLTNVISFWVGKSVVKRSPGQ